MTARTRSSAGVDFFTHAADSPLVVRGGASMQQPQSKVGLYCQVNTNGPLCNVSIQNVPLFEMYSASIPTLLASLPATAP